MAGKLLRWVFGGYYLLVGVLFGLTLLGAPTSASDRVGQHRRTPHFPSSSYGSRSVIGKPNFRVGRAIHPQPLSLGLLGIRSSKDLIVAQSSSGQGGVEITT